MAPFSSDPVGSVIFALGVAFLVSFDAIVVTINQYPDFSKNTLGQREKRPITNALMHAIFHTSLFVLYFIIIGFAIEFAIPTLLEDVFLLIVKCVLIILNFLFDIPLDEYLNILRTRMTFFYQSILFFGGLAILFFVWNTYREKIVEDHSQKPKLRGKKLHPRPDIRFLFQLFRVIPLTKNFFSISIAFAVAVDMLAISAFIRVFFKGQLDRGPENEGHLVFFKIFENQQLNDISVFGLLIFVFVLFFLWIAGWAAIVIGAARNDEYVLNARRVCRFFRYAEPVLIFMVLGYALAHVIGLSRASAEQVAAASNLWIFMNWLAFGFGMTGSLIFYHRGFSAINTACDNGLPFTAANQGIPRASLKRHKRRIALYVKKWCGNWKSIIVSMAILVASIIFSICIFSVLYDPQKSEIPYRDFLASLSALLSIVVAALVFWPFHFSLWEIEVNQGLSDPTKGRLPLASERGYAAFGIAFIVVIIFSQFRGWILGLAGVDPIVLEMIFLLVFGMVFVALLLGRSGRYVKQAASMAQKGYGFDKSVDISDILTALGTTILLFQVLVVSTGLK